MFKIVRIYIIFIIFIVSCFKNVTSDIVITNVNIIDFAGAPIKENMTILIKDNRIVNIVPSKKFKTGKHNIRINGSGKYLIPGLWDMHVHFAKLDYLPIYIANGILGIRIMNGRLGHHYIREKIRENTLLGPRMVIASSVIDGANPVRSYYTVAANESDARKIVRQSKSNGADFIKVYTKLSRQAYFAILNESKKLKIPVAGHVPIKVSTFEVSNGGQKCIEHLTYVILACLNTEESIRQKGITKYDHHLYKDSSYVVWNYLRNSIVESLNENYNKNKADSLFQLFVKNDTWHCPTLITHKYIAYLDDDSITNDIELQYFDRKIKSSWENTRDGFLKIMNKEDRLYAKKYFHHNLTIVNRMHNKGVKFIAGTDTPFPNCYPGYSLHDELELMVQAGLSPLEALKTATINPAIFNETIDSMGTIEIGKIADLVLLDANPLDNIVNTKKINTVIYNSKVFKKKNLEKMLKDIKSFANK